MATFTATVGAKQGRFRLGYWGMRGLAQPIRYLLEYTVGPDGWEDTLYKQAGPYNQVPFDKSCWFDVKQSLGLDFPNLPYLIDEMNGLKLTQSQAILRHVARLHPSLNLLGADLASQAKVDLLLAEFADCKGKMTGLQYSAGLEGAGADFITGSDTSCLCPTLDRFSAFLGPNLWFVGDHLTVADFVLFEYLMCACLYNNAYLKSVGRPVVITVVETGNTTSTMEACPDGRGLQPLLASYDNLQAFKIRFESIPQIASYLSSDRFADVKGMNNQHAKFR